MSLKKEIEIQHELENWFRLVDERRKQSDLSYRQLSAKAGVAHGTYWCWARGKSAPNLQSFLRYCKVLGLKLSAERV